MKSLEERHAERAKRKFENMTEAPVSTGNGVGNVANLLEAAQTAFNGLTDEEKQELFKTYDGLDPSQPSTFSYEDDEGNNKYAGIGIVSPFVIPYGEGPPPVDLSVAKELAGGGGGAPLEGNLNGRAVEAATAAAPSDPGATGWGKPSDDDSANAPAIINEKMTVAEIQAIADKEEIDITSASNNADRVKLITEARNAKANG